MDRNCAITTMNRFGKQRIPFLFVIDFDMKSPVVIPVDDARPDEILFDINGFKNFNDKMKLKKQVRFTKTPLTLSHYRTAFNNVQRYIGTGNTYLINLTFPTRIETNLNLLEIFKYSKARYRLLFKDQFVVFSPEIFVQIRKGKISSNPMKGTIDASIKNAKAKLLTDKKELAEHTTVVDLIRNDLSIVARRVCVEIFRYIERVKTHGKDLFQISSKISGTLPADYRSNIGSIIFDLLPAGSISGAPKKRTVQIIKQVEKYDRGYYTGVFGYYDGETLDSGVMIRFIENRHGKLIYKSGGGITAFSNLNSEHRELIDKIYVPIV